MDRIDFVAIEADLLCRIELLKDELVLGMADELLDKGQPGAVLFTMDLRDDIIALHRPAAWVHVNCLAILIARPHAFSDYLDTVGFRYTAEAGRRKNVVEAITVQFEFSIITADRSAIKGYLWAFLYHLAG